MKALLLSLSLACAPALSQPPLSVGALVAMTRASEESRGIAYGYLVGVLDSADARASCPPAELPQEKLLALLSTDLEEAPVGLPAASFILQDLSLRWPCGPRLVEK
jgi:hypothetical protein